MADVNLAPYDVRAAQIAQQQKMAQLLAQQAQQPFEVGSYKGIQAPISPYQGINKVLQSVLAAYQMKKGASDLGALNQSERDDFLQSLGGSGAPAAPASPPPDFSANAPAVHDASQFEIAPGQGQKLAAALSGAQAPQSPPQAQPDPTQAPPPGNGPAIASALQGPQAPPPPQAQPMPTLPPPQGPQIGPAPDVTMGPQDAAPPAAPAPDAAPADPMQARLAAAQANLRNAQIKAAHFAGTPYATPAAAAVTAAQEQVKKIGDLQDAATAKEAERVAQTNRTVHFIADVPGLDDNTRKVLTLGAAADPDTAKVVTAAMVKDAFTHKLVQATPQDLQGYPQGTIAQKDPVSGKLENIYNPVPNLMAIANEKLHAQEVSLSGARLGLERQRVGLESQRFAFDKEQKSNALLDPATVQQMAMQARQGDVSVFQNLGRGAQGAQNIVALRRAIFDPALGPMTGQQMAQMNANFKGVQAEQRAVGSRVGNAAVGASEVPLLANVADQAYSKLSRSELVPFNRLKQMVESGTSSPAQAAAYAADSSVVNAFARAISPTGVGTDAARSKGEKMLNTAMGPEAHRAVLNQLITETNSIKAGAQAAMGTGQTPAAQIGAGVHAPYADPAKEARYQAWLKAHGH